MDDLSKSLPFQVGGYYFNRLIGSGSYSYCFEVYSNKYQQNFCAKVTPISPEFIDENGNYNDMELYALMSLDHINIMRIYDYFISEGYLFLILELCNGSLATTIARRDPFDARSIIEALAKAVNVCHKANIAHRDIKPSNVFFDKYGRPKLGDFGLSSYQESVNNICGSKPYLAPETFYSKNYDPFKADVWSLGVTFYEIITGKQLFPNGPPEDASFEVKFPKTIDQRLLNLIQQMIKFDPKNRITIQEVCEDKYFTAPEGLPRLKVTQSTSQPKINAFGNIPQAKKPPPPQAQLSSVKRKSTNGVRFMRKAWIHPYALSAH
ncbi:CAMK family protein kinase [Histomonas meleagridis]|uniref:CAMK family protein kinase n=1 Tax=Histomonas meleagridis TaxID=135588 RepID=UPI00355A299B|nr:CAMK family protein kinase [Histomonas meleagridis]KAH0805320.1 CAMK family protein kinase [Histomonas meleagridis]